ncbi:MAG: hypothetical protein II124_06730, partial [Clostridia bacterium]|nr:hypothetical protein [Clostridia bacterium]
LYQCGDILSTPTGKYIYIVCAPCPIFVSSGAKTSPLFPRRGRFGAMCIYSCKNVTNQLFENQNLKHIFRRILPLEIYPQTPFSAGFTAKRRRAGPFFRHGFRLPFWKNDGIMNLAPVLPAKNTNGFRRERHL